jgi:hypothetical protein
MAAVYSKSSPYYGTEKYGNFLDIMNYRKIPAQQDDVVYTIDRIYQHRPDLLAHDLYEDSGLWWVFMARNPNVITDPIGDFVPGVSIRIPKKTTLAEVLGL